MNLVQIRRRPGHAQPSQLEEDLRSAVPGEVRFDQKSRGLYSMDASNFRIPPQGVVVPRNVDDVVAAVDVCRHHDIPIVSRGGGTGLAGQSLNRGIVIDHAKWLRDVVEVDPHARTARVQAGCVLDDLRDAAEVHGLTYGPDPATHDRCTLGGMVGNNSCGTHSMLAEFYGPGPRTEDNIASLEVLTYDGLRLRVGPTSDNDYRQALERGGREAEIYKALHALRERHGDAIRKGFPRIQRRVSGYNLPELLPENGFNVAAALVGSEATCVTVLEVTTRLISQLPHRALLILGYPDIYRAGDDVPRIREFRPVGLEGIDRRLVEFMRKKHLHEEDLHYLPEGGGWLLVEFGAESRAEALAQAEHCQSVLQHSPHAPKMSLIDDPLAQQKVWKVRESGLGATAFVPGSPDAWPGWEDSAVPVDKVGAYLRSLRALFERYGYDPSLYGHLGQGCIHCRVNFDLESQQGVDQYMRFTQEAAELCVSFGGALSGEHGDGQQRSDLLHLMYGPELMQAFAEFKAIWDPHRRMNPGRIVEPAPRNADLKLNASQELWHPQTHFAYPQDDDDFGHAALRCVGVGECRREDSGTMCPSYMVTHEEADCTRGRAHLLFEMARGEVVKDGWRSKEVRDALELCLSCKACKSECPVNVDMATYKAEFLAHHYAGRLRPRQAYAFGHVQRWARLASLVPRLTNLVTHTPGLASTAKWVAGMAPQREVPRFAPRSFRRWFAAHHRSPSHGTSPRVLLWPDTFNNHFSPEVLQAGLEVLEAAGAHVVLPSAPICCGRPTYDYGLLDHGRALFKNTLNVLQPELELDTKIVGMEPSCVAALRDELPRMLPNDERAHALAQRSFTLAEYLMQEREEYAAPELSVRALVHGHCQGRAVMGHAADDALLDAMGVNAQRPDAGCCGMAGSFGFERGRKYEVSVAAGERKLLPAVRALPDEALIVADGFSCREQIRQLSGRGALHTAQLLRRALT